MIEAGQKALIHSKVPVEILAVNGDWAWIRAADNPNPTSFRVSALTPIEDKWEVGKKYRWAKGDDRHAKYTCMHVIDGWGVLVYYMESGNPNAATMTPQQRAHYVEV